MAAAHVQTSFNHATTATSISVTLTLTAGNAVIVTLLAYFTNGTITQTAGDTVTQRWTHETGGEIVYQYSNPSVAGGSTTFTFTTPSDNLAMFVTEVSGLKTSTEFDTSDTSSISAVATTFATGTPTLAQTDFCLAVLHLDGSGGTSGLTASNGFTVPANGNQVGAAPTIKCAIAYLVTGTGTSTTFTVNDSSTGHADMGCYKEAAGGTPITGLRPAICL